MFCPKMWLIGPKRSQTAQSASASHLRAVARFAVPQQNALRDRISPRAERPQDSLRSGHERPRRSSMVVDVDGPARGNSTPLMARLREETRAAHELTEEIPFSQALLNHTLPLNQYVAQLRALALVHLSLETALSESHNPIIRAVWRPSLAKLPLLDEDLAFFGCELGLDRPQAVAAATALADEITHVATSQPIALLGYLYVLEGSTLGGTVLRKHIRAAYDLEGEAGLAYYSVYGRHVMPNWRQFKARMDAAVPYTCDRDAIVAASRRAFVGIGEVLNALL